MTDPATYSRFITREGIVLPGVRRVVPVASPAAGNDWSVSVPGGCMWRLLSGVATFTTSAAVGNRRVHIAFNVDGVNISTVGTGGNQAAGLTLSYTIARELQLSNPTVTGLWGFIAIPDFWVPAQGSIGSLTLTMQAGDQWSGIALYVEELYATDQELAEWHERQIERMADAIRARP